MTERTEIVAEFYSGGGIAYTLVAHISTEQPKVLRKWKRK